MGYIVTDLVQFQFFALNIIFLLLEVELLFLDLNGIVGLVGAGSRLFFLLQLGNGGLYAFQLIFLSLEFDLSLGQILFVFGIVIGKERCPDLYLIACLDQDLLDHSILSLVEGLGLLGFHRAGISVENAVGGILAGQGRYRSHIGHILSVAAPGTVSSPEIQYRCQHCDQDHNDGSCQFFSFFCH